MSAFLDSGYGIILIFWGLVFELGGLLMGVLAYRAIQHDQQHADQNAAALQPAPEPAAEPVAPGPTGLTRVA